MRPIDVLASRIMAICAAFTAGMALAIVGLAMWGLFGIGCEVFHWTLKPRHVPPGYILQYDKDSEHWFFVMFEHGGYSTNWSGGPSKQDVIDYSWKAHKWNNP